jgi:hypothetical protein
MARVLVISDTQIPFQHRDYIPFLKAVAAKYKTTEVVHIGDEVDFHAISEHDSDPDGMSPGDELKAALKELKILYKAFPKVKACISNHTARPFRKAFKYGIPKAFLKGYGEFLQAPKGWQWADHWIIDGVKYEHGEGFSGKDAALKAAHGNGRSTVIGHVHAFAGIHYSASPENLIFGMNVGCLIDRHQYAFNYGKVFKSKPIISCGVVIDGIPHLIPMILNKQSRWIGRI